jgi:hypothetical protein
MNLDLIPGNIPKEWTRGRGKRVPGKHRIVSKYGAVSKNRYIVWANSNGYFVKKRNVETGGHYHQYVILHDEKFFWV